MDKSSDTLRYKYSVLDIRVAIIKHELRRLYKHTATYYLLHSNGMFKNEYLVNDINVPSKG